MTVQYNKTVYEVFFFLYSLGNPISKGAGFFGFRMKERLYLKTNRRRTAVEKQENKCVFRIEISKENSP